MERHSNSVLNSGHLIGLSQARLREGGTPNSLNRKDLGPKTEHGKSMESQWKDNGNDMEILTKSLYNKSNSYD